MPNAISKRLHAQRAMIAKDVVKLRDRNEVARIWKCSRPHVDQVCHEFNVDRHTLWQDELIRIVADLILTTDPLSKIAERHGLSKTSVVRISRFCREAGLDTSRPLGRPKGKKL